MSIKNRTASNSEARKREDEASDAKKVAIDSFIEELEKLRSALPGNILVSRESLQNWLDAILDVCTRSGTDSAEDSPKRNAADC